MDPQDVIVTDVEVNSVTVCPAEAEIEATAVARQTRVENCIVLSVILNYCLDEFITARKTLHTYIAA